MTPLRRTRRVLRWLEKCRGSDGSIVRVLGCFSAHPDWRGERDGFDDDDDGYSRYIERCVAANALFTAELQAVAEFALIHLSAYTE